MDLIAGFRLPDGGFEYFATVQPPHTASVMLAMRTFVEGYGLRGWLPVLTYDFESQHMVRRVFQRPK